MFLFGSVGEHSSSTWAAAILIWGVGVESARSVILVRVFCRESCTITSRSRVDMCGSRSFDLRTTT